MARNGSGTMVLAAGNPVVSGTTIASSVQNNTMSDIANELTNSIARDGQSPATANIPFGGFKATGLGAATVAGDAVRYEQLAVAQITSGTIAGAAITTSTLNSSIIGGTTPAAATVTTLTATGASSLAAVTASGAVIATSTVDLSGAVLQGGTPLVFEGATADDFETTFAITDPTADRTITFKDESGTVAYLADIPAAAPVVIEQVQYTQTGSLATGSTAIPYDDTIPQNTEGDQYMSLAITPTNVANTLEIEVVFFGCENGNTSDAMTVALFQDSTADALAAGSIENDAGGSNSASPVTFRHRMAAGTTSATTFKVRAGLNNANVLNFNGTGAARKLGGVYASSIKITEYGS